MCHACCYDQKEPHIQRALHFCLAIVLHCKTHFRFIFCIFFFHLDTIKDPWEHVAFGVVGGTLGYQFSKYNDRNRQDLLQLMGSMDKFGTAETSHDED